MLYKLAKSVRQIVAHNSSITSLICYGDEIHLISGDDEGIIKIWDIRMEQCLNNFKGHNKKYDEGTLSLACLLNEKIIISGGADSTIKVWNSQI